MYRNRKSCASVVQIFYNLTLLLHTCKHGLLSSRNGRGMNVVVRDRACQFNWAAPPRFYLPATAKEWTAWSGIEHVSLTEQLRPNVDIQSPKKVKSASLRRSSPVRVILYMSSPSRTTREPQCKWALRSLSKLVLTMMPLFSGSDNICEQVPSGKNPMKISCWVGGPGTGPRFPSSLSLPSHMKERLSEVRKVLWTKKLYQRDKMRSEKSQISAIISSGDFVARSIWRVHIAFKDSFNTTERWSRRMDSKSAVNQKNKTNRTKTKKNKTKKQKKSQKKK